MNKIILLGMTVQHLGWSVLGAFVIIAIGGQKLSTEFSSNDIVLASFVLSALISGAALLVRIGIELQKRK